MTRGKIHSAVLLSILVIVSLIVVFPFILMTIMGTYYTNDLFTGLKLLPGSYVLQNLKSILRLNYARSYLNSAIISIASTALALLVCSLAGYAFAKYSFRGRKQLFGFAIALMMIPWQLGLIAFVVEMKTIGWTNTFLPMIVPSAANVFAMYWLSENARGAVPDEVLESARMDGCGELRIFFQIAVPFLRPALLSIGLLMFLWSWNSFVIPLTVITRVELYTVPLMIKSLNVLFYVDFGAQILGLSIGTIPIVVIFVFFMNSLIRGLSAVAVKG